MPAWGRALLHSSVQDVDDSDVLLNTDFSSVPIRLTLQRCKNPPGIDSGRAMGNTLIERRSPLFGRAEHDGIEPNLHYSLATNFGDCDDTVVPLAREAGAQSEEQTSQTVEDRLAFVDFDASKHVRPMRHDHVGSGVDGVMEQLREEIGRCE